MLKLFFKITTVFHKIVKALILQAKITNIHSVTCGSWCNKDRADKYVLTEWKYKVISKINEKICQIL